MRVGSRRGARIVVGGTRDSRWFDPTFHPTNVSIRGITGHHQLDWQWDEPQVDGTIQHHMDGLTSTHNPWVAGSIPARPTKERPSVSGPLRRIGVFPSHTGGPQTLRWRRGTADLDTGSGTFTMLLLAVVLIVGGMTYFPSLALSVIRAIGS
jgi:Potassium-transporting ATPase A subunit